jgi:hypothetical protein
VHHVEDAMMTEQDNWQNIESKRLLTGCHLIAIFGRNVVSLCSEIVNGGKPSIIAGSHFYVLLAILNNRPSSYKFPQTVAGVDVMITIFVNFLPFFTKTGQYCRPNFSAKIFQKL